MGGNAPQIESQVASTEPVQERILRRNREGTFWPLQGIGQGLRRSNPANGRSGGLELRVLRRSNGVLVGRSSRDG